MSQIGLCVEKDRTLFHNTSIKYLFIWTVINLSFLVIFPFAHSDESWLAGLSRAILAEGNAAATEPFFNLFPRAPHAVKILFHILQIIFIKIFGYSLFSVRLVSLLTGTAAAAVFGLLCNRLDIDRLTGRILLSIQIQFLYASHFGRQEIQLILLMLLSLYVLFSYDTDTRSVNKNAVLFRKGLLSGLPISAAIGFHPNAFIIAWPAGLIMLTEIIRKRRKIIEGAGFLLLPAAAAIVIIILSLQFNSSFVSDYTGFGEEVGVMEPIDIKLLGFDDFYRKLFLRISGTYYTPRIWPVFILAAVSAAGIILSGIYNSLKSNRMQKEIKTISANSALQTAITGIIGINTGIILLGKYSAPSIIFIIPFLVLLVATALQNIRKTSLRRVLSAAAILFLSVNSVVMIHHEISGKRETYAQFLNRIESAVGPQAEGAKAEQSRVLGPLSVEFALDYGRLLDWRNLTALPEIQQSVADYIKENNIEYIIYTEEYDVIYRDRPVWNILYGNPVNYHEQLQVFLRNECELVDKFASPGYGTRIVMHRYKQDWQVKVYRVIQNSR